MLRTAVCSLVLACTAPYTASAAALPQDMVDGFYVTLEDVRRNSEEVFQAFAGPGGGPIAKREFVSTDLRPEIGPPGENPQMLERLFGLLDVNDDGQLTREEWNTQIEKDLSFADGDGDGRITLKELANARENMSFGEAIGMLF